MQSELVMVNPNELVIDMPLDESNVKQKMESLKQSGLIQPVVVWLNDMRIIDGFHRTEAARRLEWKEIPVFVRDCPEEAFWDARIQSARQHHTVERERLLAWIAEAWKSSWIYEAVHENGWELDEEGPNERPVYYVGDRERPEPSLEHREVLAVMFDIQTERMKKSWDDLSPGYQHAAHWFASKARLWNLDTSELREALYEAFGYITSKPLDRVAARHDLSFSERSEIAGQLYLNGTERVGQVRHRRLPPAAVEALDEYLTRGGSVEDGVEAIEKMKAADKWVDGQPHPLEVLTPQIEVTREQRRKQARDAVVRELGAALNRVWNQRDNLKLIDDGPALLAQHCEQINGAIAELWPHETGRQAKVHPLAKENQWLRERIRDLNEEIAALKRALDSKQRASERLADTYAYSSEEIEKMPG